MWVMGWWMLTARASSDPGTEVGLCGYRAALFAAQRYGDPDLGDLVTPNRDVARLAEALEARFGFEVSTHPDATRKDILSQLDTLRAEVAECEAVLVYFAGHGVYDDGMQRGFWLPVDAERDDRANWISNDDIAARVQALRARHVLLIADACFSGVLFRDLGPPTPVSDPGRGVRALSERRSRWVLTSGAGDELVRDQYRDGMSVFAYFLHQQLAQAPDRFLMLDTIFPDLREAVTANALQTPQQGVFHGTGHEGGQLVLVNREGVEDWPTPRPAADPDPELWTSPLGVQLVWVPGGEFSMGSPADEEGRDNDEGLHLVTVDGLWVMESEVTQGLWTEVMGSDPSHFDDCGSDCPVESVSWFDAVAFANRLSTLEGLDPAYTIQDRRVQWDRRASGYRLLTEAEWEHAARGGQHHVYAGSDDAAEIGWVEGSGGSHPVCSKRTNGYGLCDMTGNVWEWVWDGYGPYPRDHVSNPSGIDDASYRVRRGGSYNLSDRNCRIANRYRAAPGIRLRHLGVRLGRPARG